MAALLLASGLIISTIIWLMSLGNTSMMAASSSLAAKTFLPMRLTCLLSSLFHCGWAAACASLIQTGKKNSKLDLSVFWRRPPSYASLDSSSAAVPRFLPCRLTPTPSMACVYSLPVLQQQMFVSIASHSLPAWDPPRDVLTSERSSRKVSMSSEPRCSPNFWAKRATRPASDWPPQIFSSCCSPRRFDCISRISSSSKSSSTALGFCSQNLTADW
mmetsp:Transcript_73621/g.175550  ORF Transcript_73621/g.175550 Transcript_73621/m.175550 type:complete len:216 (+) Transcript_73621:848-1495(+)